MMRKLIMKLALLVVLLVPTVVQAQTAMHLSSVNVDIWPEYDQPAVLVVTHITLAPDTVLPATLTLRIPAGAQVNAVAIVDPAKGLINAPYDSAMQGKWSVLTITANSLKVQVEYYQALVKTGTTRHRVFEWAGDGTVDMLEANFLMPVGADKLSIDPAALNTGAGQDGLTNYRVQKANLSDGASFTLTIDYQRQTDELSIASLPVQAVSTPGPDTPGRISMPAILPWVLAGIGVVLIVAGVVGFIVWQRGSQGSEVRKKRVSRRGEIQTDIVYCHECGKRAQPGDVFCRTCGARLKQGMPD
jgi:hypothetical protein